MRFGWFAGEHSRRCGPRWKLSARATVRIGLEARILPAFARVSPTASDPRTWPRGSTPQARAGRARPARIVTDPEHDRARPRAAPRNHLPAVAGPDAPRWEGIQNIPVDHMTIQIKYRSIGFPEGTNIDANGTAGSARACTRDGAIARRDADSTRWGIRGKFARRN